MFHLYSPEIRHNLQHNSIRALYDLLIKICDLSPRIWKETKKKLNANSAFFRSTLTCHLNINNYQSCVLNVCSICLKLGWNSPNTLIHLTDRLNISQ